MFKATKAIQICKKNKYELSTVLDSDALYYYLENRFGWILLISEDQEHQAVIEIYFLKHYFIIEKNDPWMVVLLKDESEAKQEPLFQATKAIKIREKNKNALKVILHPDLVEKYLKEADGYMLLINGTDFRLVTQTHFLEHYYTIEMNDPWRIILLKDEVEAKQELTEEPVFKPVPQFPGYEVDRDGHVRNIRTSRDLPTYVVIWKNGKSYRMATELLAYSAFKAEDDK